MDIIDSLEPEETAAHISENVSEELQGIQEPSEKRQNYSGASDELILEKPTAETHSTVAQYFESIDLAHPSTSNLAVSHIFQPNGKHQSHNQAHSSVQNMSSFSSKNQVNRLRAHRNTSSAIAEAAQKNGMQTVNRSGSRFVVPISMQAHPTPITDRILEEKDDILSQHEAFPYCCHCHSIFKTWRGFEYHVLRIHIKYRAFRCYHCQKECFFTEEEGRFHLSTQHPNEVIMLLKDYDLAKETAAHNAFRHIFLMCRDGPEVTRERIFEWESEAAQQVMKFQYLRFKRPVVLTKKLPCFTKEAQTDLTNMHIMVQPMVTRSGRLFQNVPVEFHHAAPRAEYSSDRLPATTRPRSTATQHDEDPRDREKRVAALMHAVTSSHD
ncbi:unnamed protein product [Caenorhabditis sp. 36 PRJEB53466]|nr:unnamed protein product [Caenorhabditis sp. 36 PRJEB53466]